MIQINNIQGGNKKIIVLEKKYNIENINLNLNIITLVDNRVSSVVDSTIDSSIELFNYTNIVNIRK
jgi:hypothetical protein